jgi:hypothetical protein
MVVAQAGGIKYGDVAVVDEQQSDVLLRNDWIAWAGMGLGYRAHTDGHGLHCALLPGANWFPHDRPTDEMRNDSYRPEFGLNLSIGHSIGTRLDLSMENWFYRGSNDFPYSLGYWMPNFRLGWSLFGAR